MSITRRYYRTLPRWGRRLSRRFIAAYGKPAGLWLPNDVTNKAYDFSSNRNIGTLNGGITTTASGFGTLGAAWKLNGSNACSQISLVSTATDNFSFFCQFTPGVSLQNGAIFFNGTAGSNGWGFLHNSGSGSGGTVLTVIADGLVFNAVGSAYGLSSGVPVFAHFTRIAGANTLYINGQPFATGTQSFKTPTAGGTFVGSRSASTGFWNGTVTIAGIGGPCSAAQVSQLYQALLTGEPFPLFEPQIVRRGYGIRSVVGGSSFKFRRTLSDYGTRIGSRQAIG